MYTKPYISCTESEDLDDFIFSNEEWHESER